MADDLAKARQLVARGNFRKAQKILRDLKAARPGDWRVRELLARCYIETDKLYKALKELRALLKHDPDNPDYGIAMAKCLVLLGKRDEAANMMVTLEAEKGKNPDYHYTMSTLLMHQGDYEGVLQETQRALSLLGNDRGSKKSEAFLRLERMVVFRFRGDEKNLKEEARLFLQAHTNHREALETVENMGSPMILGAVMEAFMDANPSLVTDDMKSYLRKVNEAVPEEKRALEQLRAEREAEGPHNTAA